MKNSVCIVGAGSMGIFTGYSLQLAGAEITFLVRPGRLEKLSEPQKLYSYDDQSVKIFSGYDIITDPSMLSGKAYRFIIITLDGASLLTEDGKKLVDEIGKNFKNTSTGIVIGSIGVENKKWFIERSGLNEDQVINGALGSLIYESFAVTLPTNPEIDALALANTDYGYRHYSPIGFIIDNSSEKVAQEFAELYDQNGISKVGIIPVSATRLFPATMAILAAWELLDWPATDKIDPYGEIWQLGTEASKEFQRLQMFGQAGIDASKETSAEGLLEGFRKMEKDTWPLDLAEFNRYHHGKKVNFQDHEILKKGLAMGQAEGLSMPALASLVERL